MDKEKLKKSMNTIFDSISKQTSKTAEEDALFVFLNNKKEWLGDPEKMNVMISHSFNNIIDEVVSRAIDNADFLVKKIYRDWNFFSRNVSGLCGDLYGGACSVDKGRFIIKSAIKWRCEGELPVFDPKPENYNHPETGTPKQWMELVDGLGDLKIGLPGKYLKAYSAIIIGFGEANR